MGFAKKITKHVERAVEAVVSPPPAEKKTDRAVDVVSNAIKENRCVEPVSGGVCGKPLAPGQTYVCAGHVRTN